MRVLALDLATELGYYTGDNKPQFIKFPKETRSMAYWAWIGDKLWDSGEAAFDVVVYENAIGQMAYALEVFHEFKSLTKLACNLAGITMVEFSPAAVKKSFTGNGKAKKPEIIAECLSLGVELPFKVMKSGPDKGKKRYNDNAADAVAIYHTFLRSPISNV